MGKWLVTVDDKDDVRMQELTETPNNIWVNEWVGQAVCIEDMQKMED